MQAVPRVTRKICEHGAAPRAKGRGAKKRRITAHAVEGLSAIPLSGGNFLCRIVVRAKPPAIRVCVRAGAADADLYVRPVVAI